MLPTNKVVHAEDTFCHRDYVSEVSKLQHMYVIGLILLSVLRTTKHTRLYSTTHYCTRLQGVKERIAYESVGIFQFLIVIFKGFYLLRYLNFYL